MPPRRTGPQGSQGKPAGRTLMVDTINGKVRVRAWPKPQPLVPGSQREYMSRFFTAANRVVKYWAEPWPTNAREAVRGTAFEPRDPFILATYGRLVAIAMPDGKTWWPHMALIDVSKSLDVISSTPGHILVRKAEYWQGEFPAFGAPVGAMLYRATSLTNYNHPAETPMPFDGKSYDDAGLVVGSAPWTGFTIPAGKTKCRISLGMFVNLTAGPQQVQTTRDGNGGFPGSFIYRCPTISGAALGTATTPIIPCAAGQVYSTAWNSIGDTSITVTANQTWIAIEVW